MESKGAYKYSATIPAEKLKKGYLSYNFIVKNNDDSQITYPSGNQGNYYDWDFYNRDSYEVTIVSKENPIHLFIASEDANSLIRSWRPNFKLVPTKNKNEAEYLINLEKSQEGHMNVNYNFLTKLYSELNDDQKLKFNKSLQISGTVISKAV